MNALSLNFKFYISTNTSETHAKTHSKDFSSNLPQINNPNLNEINIKQVYTCLNNHKNINLNKIVHLLNELNFKYFKERQLKKVMDTNIKNSKIGKNMINIHECEKIEKKSKYLVDTFSEVKKFKTELCHSWELTGTCKYGLNVIYIFIIYISIFLLQCVFAHGVNDLRSPLKEEKKSSYKTKLCKQFFCEGYCPYGKRCQFSHQKKSISYIDLLSQIEKSKKITKKFSKAPRLDVFKNITKILN